MSWAGQNVQDLDEAQQQALLRVVAAANQNPGDDSEDDDEREFVGDLHPDEFDNEELDDSDDAEAYEQYEGQEVDEVDEEEEEEDGIIEELDDDALDEQDEMHEMHEMAMRIKQQQQQVAAQRAAAGVSGQAGVAAQDQWAGLSNMPTPTRVAIEHMLQQYRAAGRTSLTILVLGKAFAGKTASINNMLGEPVLDVKPMADVQASVSMVTRTAHGVVLRVLDTPPLAEGDTVNTTALEMIAHAVKQEGPVDVVLFLDRLDGYRVLPLDKEVLQAITNTLGRTVWNNVVLGLTHAECLPVEGADLYESFCDSRAAGLRKAILAAGAPKTAVLPLVLLDNRRDCQKDKDGQKVLPDGRAWLPMMLAEVVQMALDAETPFSYDPKLRRAANPNNRRKWLIPVVLAAQFLFKVLVLDRMLEEDGITGDAYGPYNPEYIEDERARRKEEAAAEKRAAAKRKAKAEAKKTRPPKPAAEEEAIVIVDSSSSSDSDDEVESDEE